ncbi:MAG: hypothetical protein IJ428_00005 [Clostridia bacterium]|nr:hypothetical protein [Clostridia bacterium]
MKQPYNTALYMRLSRDDENYGDSVSIETQRTILRQFAKENQLHVIDEYIDATDIIGLKQNPTNGRRFSPIFFVYRAFSA